MSIEEWKLILVFVASIILAFGFGYLGFRYEVVEICKSGIVIGEYGVDF